jgi:hypothetical protein
MTAYRPLPTGSLPLSCVVCPTHILKLAGANTSVIKIGLLLGVRGEVENVRSLDSFTQLLGVASIPNRVADSAARCPTGRLPTVAEPPIPPSDVR